MYWTDHGIGRAVAIIASVVILSVGSMPAIGMILHWIGQDAASEAVLMAWLHIVTWGAHL